MQTCKLKEGGKARIKQTGQVVEVRRVSQHGIAVVAFESGGQYFMLHNRLVPVSSAALAYI